MPSAESDEARVGASIALEPRLVLLSRLDLRVVLLRSGDRSRLDLRFLIELSGIATSAQPVSFVLAFCRVAGEAIWRVVSQQSSSNWGNAMKG